MKYLSRVLRVGILVSVSFAPVMAAAEPVSMPPLVMREVKITGDEFIVLQATTPITNLGEYWLGYSSSDTASPGSLVPSQQLPAYSLNTGDAVLMTSDGAETCDAVLVTKLSVALSDTKGTLVIRKLESSGLTSTFTTIDSVNWIKPSATAVTTDQLDLRKESALAYPVWYHEPSLTKPWKVGNFSACSLAISQQATAMAETVTWMQKAIEPPAIIENVNDVDTSDGTVVVSNAGLAPPLITELLPNPLGTGTDASDEYIEVYNSNDAPFNLSGFTLRTGLATTHSWLVPDGTTINAKSFKTFYAGETGLSMSNTSGQATLLDTQSAVVAQTDPYDSAPDGQAWSLANGAWYWTTKPTPNTINDIAQPIVSPATAAKKLTNKKTSVKGAATTKAKKATSAKTKKATALKSTTGTPPSESRSSSLHPAVLAAVAAAAVGYGLYEYRHDLANALHKLRRH